MQFLPISSSIFIQILCMYVLFIIINIIMEFDVLMMLWLVRDHTGKVLKFQYSIDVQPALSIVNTAVCPFSTLEILLASVC